MAATRHGTEKAQMSFGARRNQEASQEPRTPQSADEAVSLARQDKIHPRELLTSRYANSESVYQFLWEGKLSGKSQFRDLRMNFSDTSITGFSKAAVSLLKSNPSDTVESLWSVVKKNSAEITRDRVSDEFLRKLDSVLADQLLEDLHLPARSNSPASLNLAKALGGRQSALAIAKPQPRKALLFGEFPGMLGAMIALDEPETYDMIVNAWINHSGSTESLESIGEAIEPNFLSRLDIKLKKLEKGDKRQQRTIPRLIKALGQTGTEKSVPRLEELRKSKVKTFRETSTQALKRIRQRTGR